MGNVGIEMRQVSIRIPADDYDALENEARGKGIPLAAYIRDLLQAHVQNKNMSEKIESEFSRLLESDKFDDIIVEKFLRAYDRKRKN